MFSIVGFWASTLYRKTIEAKTVTGQKLILKKTITRSIYFITNQMGATYHDYTDVIKGH